MKITYNKQEVKKIIHEALCNGLTELSYSGIQLELDNDLYKLAKDKLIKLKKEAFLEDIYLQMLTDGSLTFVDVESDEEPVSINFKTAMKRINECKEHLNSYPLEMHQEQGDAETAYLLLQIILFEDVIYG